MNQHCKLVDDYVEGALDLQTAEGFEKHLAHCASCVAEIEAAKEMTATLQSAWDSIAAPERVVHSIREQDLTQQNPNSLTPLQNGAWVCRARWLSIAAAITLLLLGSVWMLSSPQRLVESNKASQTVMEEQAPFSKEYSKVVFLNEGAGRDTILIESPSSNERFTILKAYPVVSYERENFPKGQTDVETN